MGISEFVTYLTYLPLINKYKKSSTDTRRQINQDAAKYLRQEKYGDEDILTYSILIKCLRSEYFRVLFYHRTGGFNGWLKRYKRASCNLIISPKCLIMGGVSFKHPYNTIINAKRIGKNFVFRHLTTIGNKIDGRNDLVPTIGDNVTLGANVIIIGDIQVGDNVIVGAGSVITKDVPSNCIVAGNPAKVIRTLQL